MKSKSETKYGDKTVSIEYKSTERRLKEACQKIEKESDSVIQYFKRRKVGLDKYDYDLLDPYIDTVKQEEDIALFKEYHKPGGYYDQEENLEQLKRQEKKELENEVQSIEREIAKYQSCIKEDSPEINNPHAIKPTTTVLVMIFACVVDFFLNFSCLDVILQDKVHMTLLGTCFVSLLCDIICPSIIANKIMSESKRMKDLALLIITGLCNYCPLVLLAIVRIKSIAPQTITVGATTVTTQVSAGEILVGALFGVIPILTTIATTIAMILYSKESYQSFEAMKAIRKLEKKLKKVRRKFDYLCLMTDVKESKVQLAYFAEQANINQTFLEIKMLMRVKFKKEFAEDANDVNFLTDKERNLILEDSKNKTNLKGLEVENYEQTS